MAFTNNDRVAKNPTAALRQSCFRPTVQKHNIIGVFT